MLSGRIGVNRDVLVYVHGFNTSLERGPVPAGADRGRRSFRRRAGAVHLAVQGALLAYGADKESATASRDALRKLLEDDRGDARRRPHPHLAHSMGTWLTMEALRESALSGSPDLHGKLGNVMLAAPDIDLSVFRSSCSGSIRRISRSLSPRTTAPCKLSASIQGDRRLGSLDPGSEQDREMIESSASSVFDISDLSTALIGHDIYADAPLAVRQIGSEMTKPRPDEAV